MSSHAERVRKLSRQQLALAAQRAGDKRREHSGSALRPRPSGTDPLPLSFAQQRLWFLDQLKPGNPFYHLRTMVRFRGQLNLAALDRALHSIIQRHENLRTRFAFVDGQPVQQIVSQVLLRLPIVDVSLAPASEQEAWVSRLAAREVRRPFDLARGPLARFTLIRLHGGEHVACMTWHHIIADVWSQSVFLRELSAFYTAFAENRAAPLPPLPIQYADFAVWQRQWLQGKVLEKQVAYWRQQLEGAPPLLALPTDRPRPEAQTFRGRRYTFAITADELAALNALSQRETATLFMTLLTAFQVLLYRYSGQGDISIGTPVADRRWAETEPLIGFFVNTLVMRTVMDENLSFRELLAQVRQTCLAAYAHQDIPFELLVDELQTTRSLNHSPLFQVMMTLRNTPHVPLSLTGLTLQLLESDRSAAIFDLFLSIREHVQGLSCVFEYATDLFDDVTIARLARYFQTLLRGIIADPGQCLNALPLLTPAERHELLTTWNATQMTYPQPACIHHLAELQARQTPDAVALCDGETQLTYAKLDAWSTQVAHHLCALGVGPEVRVGLCLERSVSLAVGVLGVLKAGGAYLPLDPAYPSSRLAFMLDDAAVPVLLTQRSLRSHLPPSKAEVICLDDIPKPLAPKPLEEVVPVPRQNGVTADLLAYVIYTSGSTGRPKGVQISHRAVVNFLHTLRATLGITAHDTLVAITTLSFDIAVLELILPLTVGARVIVASRETAADGTQLMALLTSAGATVMQATPATWRLLLGVGWKGSHGMRLLCGGEALPRDLAAQLLGTGAVLWNLYGPTETTIWSTAEAVVPEAGPVPIGRPVGNTQVYVLDAALQPVPVGAPGDLYIGGAGMARGYLSQPGLTAERFIPDPFGERGGGRLYRTGDLARYRPDGRLEFLGRVDAQVKLRGFRVELGEIESVLHQHPAIQDAVVAMREDMPGDQRLVAYVVVDGQEEAQTGQLLPELRSFAQQQLPEYMVPAGIMVLDALPLTPNGKIDRRALPAPEWTRSVLEPAYVPPRTPVEETLAGIWAGVLGVPQVGIHDNFFDLGGHSLLSIQITTRAYQAGLHITLAQVFRYQTIAKLAAVLEKTGTAAAILDNGQARFPATYRGNNDHPLAELNAQQQHAVRQLLAETRKTEQGATESELEAVYPLAPMQQEMLAACIAIPASGVYIIQMVWAFHGALHVSALQRAWQQVVQRHTPLRTSFLPVEPPLQAVHRQVDVPLMLHDWRQLAPDVQQKQLDTYLEVERCQGFTPFHAPLTRLTLIWTDDEVYHVVWSVHHMLLDGWSISPLLREVLTYYDAFCQGHNIQLEPPWPYRAYLDWLQQQDPAPAAHFWRQQLDGFTAPPPLGVSKASNGASDPVYARQQEWLSPGSTARLQAFARDHRLTLYTLVESAWTLLLSRMSGQTDVVFGTVTGGRPPDLPGVESMVGALLNIVPVRVQVVPEMQLLSWLQQLQTEQAIVRQYEHYTLHQIRQWSGIAAEVPLFESLIRFANYPGGKELAESSRHLPLRNVRTVDIWHYPLTFVVVPGNELLLQFTYDQHRFGNAGIDKMMGQLRVLLDGMVRQPGQRLSELMHP